MRLRGNQTPQWQTRVNQCQHVLHDVMMMASLKVKGEEDQLVNSKYELMAARIDSPTPTLVI